MNHTSFIDLELEDAWQWEPELSLDANPLMEEWPSFDKNVWEEAACSWGVSNMQVGETVGLLGGDSDLGLEQGLGSSESMFMTVDGDEGVKNLPEGPAAKQAKQEPAFPFIENGHADSQRTPALASNPIPPEAKPPVGSPALFPSQVKSHPRRARSTLGGRLRGRAAVVKGAMWKGGSDDTEKPRKVSSRHSSPRPGVLPIREPTEDMKAGADPGSPQSPLQSWPSMGAMTPEHGADQKSGEVNSSVLDPALDKLARKRAKAAEKSMRHRRKKKAAEAEAAERVRKQEDTIRKLRAMLAEAGEENVSLKRRNEELQQEVARLRNGFS